MVEMMVSKETSYWWWFDSHFTSTCSPWLRSTLGEIDMKTKAVLKLLEDDADSFAECAEMYYEKRPELIRMVEDLYRSCRSLAERSDRLNSSPGNRVLTTFGSPFLAKRSSDKPTSTMDQNYEYESHSGTYDIEDSAEIEVDEYDPPQEDELLDTKTVEYVECEKKEIKVAEETQKVTIQSAVGDDEILELREEIARLKEENQMQKEQLWQKDEEKREVIRQLSVAVEMQRAENLNLKNALALTVPRNRRTAHQK